MTMTEISSDNRRKRWFLARAEFIGLQVQVIDASDPGLIGISGRVVDETKNTLVIRTSHKEVVVPKRIATFRFTFKDEEVDLRGSVIAFRPEDRPKKVRLKHIQG